MCRLIAVQITTVGMLLGCAGLQSARAEVILGAEQDGININNYLRLTGGYPTDPSTTTSNSTFYLPSLDLSGVGWVLPGIFSSAAWNVTMIDSQHFIGAWHTNPTNVSVGSTVNFLPLGASSIASRTVANLQQVPNAGGGGSDVMLGTLNAPVPAGVAAYPIAAAATAQQLLYVYGAQSQVGQNNLTMGTFILPTSMGPQPISSPGLYDVGTGATLAYLFDYDQPNSNPDGQPSTVGTSEAALSAGDSGGPTFVMVGGQLELLGDNMFNISYDPTFNPAPPGTVDSIEWSGATDLASYAAEIQTLIAVPEPSSLAFCAVSVAGAVGASVRSRRRQPAPA